MNDGKDIASSVENIKAIMFLWNGTHSSTLAHIHTLGTVASQRETAEFQNTQSVSKISNALCVLRPILHEVLLMGESGH